MKAYAVDMVCKGPFGVEMHYVLYLVFGKAQSSRAVQNRVAQLAGAGVLGRTDRYGGRYMEVEIHDAQATMGRDFRTDGFHLMNPSTYFVDWQAVEASSDKLRNAPAETKKGRSNSQQSAKAAMSPVDKVVASVGEKLPGLLDEAARTVNKAPEVIAKAPEVIANVLEGVRSIVSILGSIASMLPLLAENMKLLLKAQEEAWKGMEPIYKHFNEEVVEPYKQLMTTDAGKVLKKLREDILAGNLSSDVLTPDIPGPWSSPADYGRYSMLFSNPFAGPGNLAALNVMRQVRYEQGTGRGPSTVWDVMARASTMGQPDAFSLAASVPHMASDAGQMAAKIPDWWMSNFQTPPIAEPKKKIVPRPDAGQKSYHGKAMRPKPRR